MSETRSNRISAERLCQIAATLDLPVTHFYDAAIEGDVTIVSEELRDLVRAREDAKLLKVFRLIEDPKVRQRVLELLESVAASLRDRPQ